MKNLISILVTTAMACIATDFFISVVSTLKFKALHLQPHLKALTLLKLYKSRAYLIGSLQGTSDSRKYVFLHWQYLKQGSK